jgi:hypothetical protein
MEGNSFLMLPSGESGDAVEGWKKGAEGTKIQRMPTAKYILSFLKIGKWRWKLCFVSMREQVVYFVDGMVGYLLKDIFQPSIWFDTVHFAGTE